MQNLQKIAANQPVTPEQLRKIACLGFAVALSSPTLRLEPAKVKEATAKVQHLLVASSQRHAALVDLVKNHVTVG